MHNLKLFLIIGLVLSVQAVSLSAQNIPIPLQKPMINHNIKSDVRYDDYQKLSKAYWDDVSEKRKLRNQKRKKSQKILLEDYVLEQPPKYNDFLPQKTDNEQSDIVKPIIPFKEDFIQAAIDFYGFKPEFPKNEAEFMASYAKEAKKLGFNREQIVAIYAFETGGNGTYDLQSGMVKGRKNATPISTAIGYNQLVATASVSLMWEYGNDILSEIEDLANEAKGDKKKALLKKVEIIKKMIVQVKTVPHNWNAQAKLAKTPAGFGMHAMVLDKDVGPLLQIYKLKTSLRFLKNKGLSREVSGAELEMLNLTGDGNGYDLITMPKEYRSIVPTSNFFVSTGYARNPIVNEHETVDKLLKATENKIKDYMENDGAKILFNAF